MDAINQVSAMSDEAFDKLDQKLIKYKRSAYNGHWMCVAKSGGYYQFIDPDQATIEPIGRADPGGNTNHRMWR